MSSSESEEFYDALDVSPTKRIETVAGKSMEMPTAENLELNEEKQILEAKKLVAIQRRLEDEALERRLQAIQERKAQQEVEETAKQALEQTALYNEKRRRKLEEMRMSIKDEGSKTPPEPQIVQPAGRTSQEVSFTSIPNEAQGGGYRGQDGSMIEINDNLVNNEIERIMPKDSQEPDIKSSKSSIKSSVVSSQRNDCSMISSDSVKEVSPSGVISSSSSHRVVFGGQAIPLLGNNCEGRLPRDRLSAVEPDLIQSVKRSSLGRNSSVPDMRVQNRLSHPGTELSPEELRTKDQQDRNEMPPPPIVPPRRKKKAVSMGSLNSKDQMSAPVSSGYCTPDEPTRPRSTRPGSMPPHTLSLPSSSSQDNATYLLTAPSPQVGRKALNLNDATMGDRLVTASENEHTRAVNDVELDAATDAEYQRTISIAESAVSETSILQPCSIKTGPENSDVRVSGIIEKSNSFPRSQLRQNVSSDEQAVLDQVSVLNLATGERIPMTVAEEKVPVCINPLSLHIMRRTKEYLSDSSLNNAGEGGESKKSESDEHQTINTVKGLERKKKKLKSLFGKAKSKLKSVKDEVFSHPESSSSSEDEDGERRMIKVKAAKSHKGPYDFDLLVPVQYLESAHNGAVWTMKFSPCGRLVATGGQDNLLRVWVLKDAYTYFDDMRLKYSEEQKKKLSPTVSEDSVEQGPESSGKLQGEEEPFAPFNKKPFCTYKGHTADILDVSWSKNYFILTSSMDKTVRLWHVSRKECLCCFQHIDFVTAIAFHPKDDRYFLSGSLDGKLRLWNIPDKKVTLWNEVSGSTKLITAANFCMNGKFAVVGTYDGRCVFYSTEQLKYYTQIHVRSTRGKNSRGRKVTGVEPYPGEDKILVTSNDSRIRLYDLRDLTLTCKYKGCVNNSSQIKASFSHNGRFILCGSEDHFVYIWRTQHEFHKFSSSRRDRSDYWEAIKAHNAVVTVAVFAPKPGLIIKNQFEYLDSADKMSTPDVRGEVLISADYNGTIKCFINKFKPGSG